MGFRMGCSWIWRLIRGIEWWVGDAVGGWGLGELLDRLG